MSSTTLNPKPLEHTLGVRYGLPEDEYHGGPGISKSGLWTLYDKTPAHYRFGERKETNAMSFGSAVHCAVLEPSQFEKRYMRGPDDRRGNKWGTAIDAAAAFKKECMTSGDYDDALRIRDHLSIDPMLDYLVSGEPTVEASAYWIDNDTGELCRCRPDLYSAKRCIILDLKKSRSAAPRAWSMAAAEYGYHVQEAMYASGWQIAGGGTADAFVFLTVEPEAPFAHAWYELEPQAVEEGHAVFRKALNDYHMCSERERAGENKASAWPSFPTKVQALDLPNYAYKLTQQRSI